MKQAQTLADFVRLESQIFFPGDTNAQREQFAGADLKEAAPPTKETNLALTPHAHELFNLTETNTALGRQYSFILQPGQCLRDVYEAANRTYSLHANLAQKMLIGQAVASNRLYDDPEANKPVAEVTTFVVRPIITGSENKSFDEQIDPITGRLIFIHSEVVHGATRAEIVAAAALKLVESVVNGILAQPRLPEGDALEGQSVRALDGSTVSLFLDGYNVRPLFGNTSYPNVGCAGSGSISQN